MKIGNKQAYPGRKLTDIKVGQRVILAEDTPDLKGLWGKEGMTGEIVSHQPSARPNAAMVGLQYDEPVEGQREWKVPPAILRGAP